MKWDQLVADYVFTTKLAFDKIISYGSSFLLFFFFFFDLSKPSKPLMKS